MNGSRLFAYNEHQGYGNNRCSGYALAAILAEEFPGMLVPGDGEEDRKSFGEKVYDNLCFYQDRMLDECPRGSATLQFVNSPAWIAGGTRMILPSGIVSYCAALGLSPTLFYSPGRESVFRTEVFEEDCLRMKSILCLLDSYGDFKPMAARCKYSLALTRYKHWVAVKMADGKLCLFDPAPHEFGGGEFGPGTFERLLPEVGTGGHSKYFYDILIGLCPR